MQAMVVWKDAMLFEGLTDGHIVNLDAKTPIGKSSAATPKELVVLGLGGCTAMDVIALLKKYKQPPQTLTVKIDITPSTAKQPAVFSAAALLFEVTGQVDPQKLLEAVHLSQTKYCGVSAMLSKAFPITYRVVLNGAEIGKGQAQFSDADPS